MLQFKFFYYFYEFCISLRLLVIIKKKYFYVINRWPCVCIFLIVFVSLSLGFYFSVVLQKQVHCPPPPPSKNNKKPRTKTILFFSPRRFKILNWSFRKFLWRKRTKIQMTLRYSLIFCYDTNINSALLKTNFLPLDAIILFL